MIPIIEYKSKGSLFGVNPGSIVKKREGNSYRNFKDKSELISFINSIKPSVRVEGYMKASCGCGKAYDFLKKEDIPENNLKCSCGRPIILYGA